MRRLHAIIFWSHLLAGVIGGIVIFIMAATGFILMYEHQMVEFAERDVRELVPPKANAPRLSLDEIIAGARATNLDAQPTGIVLRNRPEAAVAVGFGRNGTTYVNPYTGEVLGKGSQLHDWFHKVIDWHRWLGREGESRATARAITGACNLGFFWLAISGVYLWWPRSWHWRGLNPSLVFNPQLRGKARDWNWHNVIGFWSSGVLVVLTLTAMVMSYQWANDLLYTLTGSEPPPRAAGNSPSVQPQQRRGEGEPRRRKPLASFDALFARGEQQSRGWVTMMIRLPRGDGPINILIQEPTAPHMFARSQLQLNRATAEVIKWEPYADASPGRKARVWVRGLHTGEALGVAGQTVAGLASLGGCFLVWTGLAMAWRRLRYRKRHVDEPALAKSKSSQQTPTPATMRSTLQTSEPVMEVTKTTMEPMSPAPTNGHSYQIRENAPAVRSSAADKSDYVLVLYGTVTGTAESLAHKVAAALRAAGKTVRVRDMAHCQPHVLNRANCVLIIVSTYGDGEPPDDAAQFWEAVVQGNGLDLRGVKYSVLALGNTTYDHFCKCGRDFDAALERHGATRIYPRVDCDVDYDAPAAHWLRSVLKQLLADKRSALSALKESLMSKTVTILVMLAALSIIHPANAHYVWLERDGDGTARAYFGEWVDDVREKSGGLLDRIKAPRVFLGGGDPLPIIRNEDNLEIAVKGRGDLRLVDSSMAPREDKQKGGTTKTIYYARAGRSETSGKLDLEIAPVKPDDNQFVVLFTGSPLPKAEVTVAGPPKWEKRLTSDDQGRITVPMPWAGRYVLEVIHFAEKPGFSAGEKFNRTRHISSLSFVQHEGIPWSEKR